MPVVRPWYSTASLVSSMNASSSDTAFVVSSNSGTPCSAAFSPISRAISR